MSDFAVSQILAAIAFMLGLASVQFKTRRAILLCLVVSAVFNSAHFFVLHRPGPGALLLLTGMRQFVAVRTIDRRVLLFFLVATAAAFLSTFETRLSFVALCGTLLGTFGSFQPAGRKVRLFFMGGGVAWLIHNILAWTPVGIVMEASLLASSMVGYWRHERGGQSGQKVGGSNVIQGD